MYFTSYWQATELKTYDLFTIVGSSKTTQLPITIVAIDEASFAQTGLQWPWPRSMHAEIIDNLILAGAAVIAFDVLFSEASDPKDDEALANAIEGTLGAVVLSADQAYRETAYTRQWIRVDPHAEFTLAGAKPGLANMNLDSDGVARSFPPYEEAMWRQVIRTFIEQRPGLVSEPILPEGAMMRAVGPAETFPTVSYYQVLNMDPSIPEDYFADHIVLIGRTVRSFVEVGSAQGDTFPTSFTLQTGQLTAGVEIQANLIENALMGEVITPVRSMYAFGFYSLFAFLNIPFLIWWRLLRSLIGLTLLLGGALGTSFLLFQQQSLWLPPVFVVVNLALTYLIVAAGNYLIERKRAAGLKRAFSSYVSPEVVNQIVKNQDELKLDGEKRELTLLFSDLAGFTSISEDRPIDQVHRIINTYLSEMTHVIHSHGGTVVNFMGDGIMAFWGAPIANERQAEAAVVAAHAMQSALRRLNESSVDLKENKLKMRIGIKTGSVIVGNMGSAERFAYTALGDCANTASRLEGVNKYYGTEILVAQSTVDQIGKSLKFRVVDNVKVKGRHEAELIFTPCEDKELRTLSQSAFEAYTQQQWQKSCELWQEILKSYPDDPLAPIFLERIKKFQTQGIAPNWDGSTSLEK